MESIVNKLIETSDFDLLRKEVISDYSVSIRDRDVYEEVNSWNGYSFQETPDRDMKGKFHVRLGSYNRIEFTSKMKKEIEVKIQKLNALTNRFKFSFISTTDFESEFGERTWSARIYFNVEMKVQSVGNEV